MKVRDDALFSCLASACPAIPLVYTFALRSNQRRSPELPRLPHRREDGQLQALNPVNVQPSNDCSCRLRVSALSFQQQRSLMKSPTKATPE
jgi:hypothetical protein